MPTVQQKNTVLSDRRFARHIQAILRHAKVLRPALWNYFVTAAGKALNPDEAQRNFAHAHTLTNAALLWFERGYRRQYGLNGAIYKPNGARECARRRRQIARGQLTYANGLVGRRESLSAEADAVRDEFVVHHECLQGVT